MPFVERHWEIVLRGNGPARQDCSLLHIHDFDFLLVRHVYKKASPILLQTKRFWMRIDDYRPSLLPGGRVNEPEPPGSLFSFSQFLSPGVSDDYALASRVIANVVGVIRELHLTHRLKGRPIINIRNAIKTAGHVQAVGGGVEIHSLRLGQIWDCLHALAGLQVDHLESVVSYTSHKQSLALHVDAEVIDASFHTRQGDVAFERQNRGVLDRKSTRLNS